MRRTIVSLAVLALAGCSGASTSTSTSTTTSASSRPARAIFEFREEDVKIPARGLTLEGTLSLPRAPGPRPAVVLIQGSGPLGRDEIFPGQLGVLFGFDVPVFRELAEHLARAGFVVIRTDKRTCTRAQGCHNAYPETEDVDFDDVLDDVQAVITWLRARPEVDPRAIHLVGHSLGGAFVPELMIDNPDLGAGVVLAAPYRPIDLTSVYQLDYAEKLLFRRNSHPLVIGQRVKELREIADGVVALRAGTLTATGIAGAPVSFWQAWMDLGDALPAVIDRLDRPLLVLSGTDDGNVPPSETALWRQRLAAARPDPGHQVEVLPCLTHALNCVTRDAQGRERAGRHVSLVVPERIVRFLQNRARAE